MKTIEECLNLLPEVLYITPEQYIILVGKEYGLTEEDIVNESYYEDAYIAITTNSARYKIRSNDYAHWDDLVVFFGDPTECCNQLVYWYEEVFRQLPYHRNHRRML